MPSVTYDGQSFLLDGRRIWLLGASIDYPRVPVELWADRIAAAKQAGFNTIDVTCPWLVHEPRMGRFVFEGQANVRRFVELCAAAGMRVYLRPGPYVGACYDNGGLPAWLMELPEVALREDSEPFLERVSLYFRRLFNELGDLEASKDGPIILVQSEHAWLCSNPEQAAEYLREITRMIRENGITVPLTNANDLWQESVGTIDTWRGWDDLLIHLRQLRAVQPDAPRLVSQFDPAVVETWGSTAAAPKTPEMVLNRLAQALASGSQVIVNPFHGGTNFGFLGGRLAGGPDRFVTTPAAAGAPLGEDGSRGPAYHAVRRLITFANHFGQVFADLDGSYHPIVRDVSELGLQGEARRGSKSGGGSGGSGGGTGFSVIPLRGPAGRIVFVFGSGGNGSAGSAAGRTTTLLLEDGTRMPIDLGDQGVGWYIFDVDLHGSGRLDYCNLCPFAMVGRSILVLHGPARSAFYLSINGTPIEGVVPSGTKPVILDHKSMALVIGNTEMIKATYFDDHTVYVGVSGLSVSGEPLPHPEFTKAMVVTKDGQSMSREIAPSEGATAPRSQARPISISAWEAASLASYVTGESPRFATLDGPATLTACGASTGYGWYRVHFKTGSARKRLVHVPRGGDRLHMFVDGQAIALAGVGPGADSAPFDLKLGAGEHALVALADSLGRFADGNELGLQTGLYGHVYAIKPITGAKPKNVRAEPVDPFELRGYIAGRAQGQLSDSAQLAWTFVHTRRTLILVDVNAAAPSGTFVLNDEPVAYHAGATGSTISRLLLEPASLDSFKRGKNVLRFAPDAHQNGGLDEISRATRLYECVEALTEGGSWAFAKWEPPVTSMYEPVTAASAARLKRMPCWWRGVFRWPRPARGEGSPAHHESVWLELTGLSKGQAYINDHNLGRYFVATVSGKRVGPQTRLYVPPSWLKPGAANQLVIFDEHGCTPHQVRLRIER